MKNIQPKMVHFFMKQDFFFFFHLSICLELPTPHSANKIPLTILSKVIESIARRENYGILSDHSFRFSLPRWEVFEESLFSANLRDLLKSRKQRRLFARQECQAIVGFSLSIDSKIIPFSLK